MSNYVTFKHVHWYMRTCVLVRSHNPTAAALGRVKRWEADLASEGISLFVSIDVSLRPGRRTARELRGMNLHTYRCADVIREYDALGSVVSTATRISSTMPLPELSILSWGFHLECINIWAQVHASEFDFVWVVEDDVGFAGSIAAFIRAYSSNSADLLCESVEPVTDEWTWRGVASKPFIESVTMFKAAEHVQRFSARFLGAAHSLARRGTVAWSEMAAPSLCMHIQYDLALFDAAHVGHKYAFDARVTQEEWESLDNGAGVPRIYHALKW